MKMETIGKFVPAILFVIVILYFTPIGNDLRAIIGGGAGILAFLLVCSALSDLFGVGGDKAPGSKFAFAVVLLGLAALMTIGYHPLTGGSDTCWDGRNNSRC